MRTRSVKPSGLCIRIKEPIVELIEAIIYYISVSLQELQMTDELYFGFIKGRFRLLHIPKYTETKHSHLKRKTARKIYLCETTASSYDRINGIKLTLLPQITIKLEKYIR